MNGESVGYRRKYYISTSPLNMYVIDNVWTTFFEQLIDRPFPQLVWATPGVLFLWHLFSLFRSYNTVASYYRTGHCKLFSVNASPTRQ